MSYNNYSLTRLFENLEQPHPQPQRPMSALKMAGATAGGVGIAAGVKHLYTGSNLSKKVDAGVNSFNNTSKPAVGGGNDISPGGSGVVNNNTLHSL